MSSLAKKITLLVLFILLTLSFATPTLAAGLTNAQISAIVGLLQSFGADAAVIASVSASLGGAVPVSPATNTTCVNLTQNLSLGDTDAATAGQVSLLQTFLSGQVTGYFGPATEQLLQSWQSSHGIVSSGSPQTTGYGAVGPQTRMEMACQNSSQPTTIAPSPVSASSAPQTTPLVTTVPANQAPPASVAAVTPSVQTLTTDTQAVSLKQGITSQAVADLVKNFWIGDTTTGHIAPTWNGIVGGTLPDRRGGLWQAATMVDVLYGDWQHNPSGQSGTRIQAEWNYVKLNFSATDFSTCGDSSSQNWASDDTGWNAGMLLQMYTVTKDPVALDYAKSAVACGFTRWSDRTGTGAFDGLWYSDVRTIKTTNDYHIKSSYDTGITLAALNIYRITKDGAYLTYAKESFDWMQSHLRRADGLYWADYGLQTPYASVAQKAASSPVPSDRPGDIHLTGSVTFLGGNMGMGVLAEGLYQATGNESYKQDAIASAQAILSSVLVGTDGVFLDDRDAWANGHFALDWAQRVVPLLPVASKDRAAAALVATANSISAKDRTSVGYYGGCWAGPVGATCAWDIAGSTANQITTSANAADFVLAAALVGSSPPPITTPVAQPLSVKAVLLGQTGEDFVGQLTQGANNVRDVHVQLTGVTLPIKSVTISTPTGAWSYPSNSTNWIVAVRPESDPTIVDLYFDHYQQYSSYTVSMTLEDGRTAIVQTSVVAPQVVASLLGQTGEDVVGQLTQGANGVPDVHLRLTNVALPIKSIRIGTATGAWAYPSNGTDWIAMLKPESDQTIVDVYFDFYKQYSSYTLYLTFAGGATETIKSK